MKQDLKQIFREELEKDTLESMNKRLLHGAHVIDIKIRIDGKDYWYQGDWLKELVPILLEELK